jgi:uncharacterized protein (TIGR00255 family)
MINSMTGYGRAAGALSPRFFATVAVKSVNHRYLETSVRLPEYLWELEGNVRAVVSERLVRGKVDVTIRVQKTGQSEHTVRINSQIANAVLPQLRAIAEEHGIGWTMSGGDLLRVPDLLEVEAVDSDIEESERDGLIELLRYALVSVSGMRAREGESLRADLETRLAAIEEHQRTLSGRRDDIRREALTSYQQRVQEIAGAAGVSVDPDRLAQEVVLMVEKGDVAEELTRLTAHRDQFRAAIEGREPAGKKLDFLSQEMLREINTIGSKSRSVDIRTLVVELKAELERIREQVQNVE